VKSARVNGGTEDMSVSHVMPMTLFALNEMRAQSQSPSSSSSTTTELSITIKITWITIYNNLTYPISITSSCPLGQQFFHYFKFIIPSCIEQ